MGVEKFKNPATRKEETVVTGVVSAIYMNALKEVKTYDKGWTPTHSVNIVVDGVKVSIGLTDKQVIGVKDENEKYHDLVKGLEISIPVEETSYQGKPQYNGRASSILVLGTDGVEAAKAAPAMKQPAAASGKRDNTGVTTGHALNGALNLIRGVLELNFDDRTVLEMAALVHKVTSDLKDVYAKENPTMSEYDVGAAVGHAVLNASRDVEEATEEALRGYALWVLNDIVPKVVDIVKDKPKTEDKKPVAKKTVKKSPTKNEATPAEVDDSQIPPSNFNDMDSDIPF